jgi:hypothetical protein
MSRMFVSHAAADKPLVEEFVDLLHLGIGIVPENVFCSSLPGMGVPTGADFVRHIQANVQNPEIVVLLISDAFLKSHFCLSEVGAAWGLNIPVYPFLIPPLDYTAVTGVLLGKQAAKLNDKSKLSDLRDDLVERFQLNQFRTSHWERVRDKFLAKLGELTQATGRTHSDAKTSVGLVESSGNLLKIGSRYFEVEKVSRPERDKIVVELLTTRAEEEAALEGLRPKFGRGTPIPFAYENDGAFVEVASVSSTHHGGKHHWTLALTKTNDRQDAIYSEMNYQGHTADDIAEMRAGRILINNPPPPKKKRGHSHTDDFLESAISGRFDGEAKIDRCVIKQMIEQNRVTPDLGLRIARLEAVFLLKSTRVIESIHEFSLGPLTESSVGVKFRGQRPHRYANEEPEVITVNGECQLDTKE